MAIIKGELRKPNLLLEDNILFSLNIETSNDFLTWSGHFTIQNTEKIKVGKTFTIKLEDDRSGKIVIQSLKVNKKGENEVLFVGTGSLK